MEKRRKYTKEFKEGAIRLVIEKKASAAQVARDLGINVTLFRRWVRTYRAEHGIPAPRYGNPSHEQLELEVKQLRKNLAIVTAERDFLKKAAAYFATETK